jgi:hypothetical protein
MQEIRTMRVQRKIIQNDHQPQQQQEQQFGAKTVSNNNSASSNLTQQQIDQLLERFEGFVSQVTDSFCSIGT